MLDIVVVLYKPGDLEQRLLKEIPALTTTPHKLHWIDNTNNARNLSTAWNELAAPGKAPYIAFLHSDIVVSRNWEKPLMNCLDKHPEVGLAVSNPARFDQLGKTFPLSDPPRPREMEVWSEWSVRNMFEACVPFVVAGGEYAVLFSCMMRRKDFETLKGFDERIRIMGNNHDIQRRLNGKDLRTVMVHASSVWHKDGFSYRKAIQDGLFVPTVEGAHWERWRENIFQSKVPQWHELSDQEREAIRRDPQFLIGSR